MPPRAEPTTLERLVPIIGWARRYKLADLRFDAMAALTLAAFTVPESLAYASLAGLPPAVGLYAGIAAMFAFAIFSSSRLLAAGVTSSLAILIAGTVGPLASGDATRAAQLAAFATLVAGGAALLSRLFRLGFLANLVSRSVLVGFSAGAGIYIAATQLGKLFGVDAGQGEFVARLVAFGRHVGDTNGWTLAVGLVALTLLLLARRFAPRLPAALIVVAIAIAVAPFLGLADRGVALVGEIPRGLPAPSLPTSVWSEWRAIVPLGLSLFVLSYVEGISAARSLAAKHGGHVDPNQELLANGIANLAAGTFQGMAVGGSLTRSSVNAEVGARTPLSGAIGGVCLLVVVGAFTGVFGNLPEPVLAAVILVAVVELVDVRTLMRIFALSKREAVIALLTGVGVLAFGMLWGIIIGIVVSLLDLLERVAFPHTAELGRVPGTEQFADRDLHPDFASPEGTLCMRVDASLVFANAHEVQQDVLDRVAQRLQQGPLHLVVLDLESSPIVDISGTDVLDALSTSLSQRGIELRLAGVKADARRLIAAALPGRFVLAPGTDTDAAVRGASPSPSPA